MLPCRIVVRFRHSSIMPVNLKGIGQPLEMETAKMKTAVEKSQKTKSMYINLQKKALQSNEKAIHRHTVVNKKILAQDRLKKLFDDVAETLILSPLAGTNMSYGNLPSAGVISAIGKISGQNCLVLANDATVKGGTIFPICLKKQLRAQEIAFDLGLPCVYLVDSGGAFLPLQSEIFPDRNHGGRVFRNQAVMSASGIPQISLVCGSCTAGAAYIPGMSDQSIIVNRIGSIFLAGPPLVKSATGEEITEEELGGATLHCRKSGVTDYFAGTEDEALETCRSIIQTLHLPKLSIEKKVFDNPIYPDDELQALSGLEKISKPDAYQVLARLLDGSKLSEFKEDYGRNLITGFGYICGILIGVMMNCGSLLSADALKGTHFVQICNNRNIPLVVLQNSFQDEPTETSGETLKDQSKLIAVLSTSKVNKICVNVGGCYGVDNYTMCGASVGPTLLFTWPGASNVSEALKGTDAELDSILSSPIGSAVYTASRMFNDGIILPEETRKILTTCLELLPVNSKEGLKQGILRF